MNHASCLPAESTLEGGHGNRSTQICIKGLESDLHADAEVHFAGWFPAPDAPVLHGRLV
jgi:hypothetical protein